MHCRTVDVVEHLNRRVEMNIINMKTVDGNRMVYLDLDYKQNQKYK